MSFDRESYRKTAVAYLARWNCVPDGEAFFTHSSLLWPALKGTAKVMLKIPNPMDDEVHGAEILKIFEARGAVRVLENDQHIYLLERVGAQGSPTLLDFVHQGDDDKATRIICDVIASLHRVSKEKQIPAFAFPFRRRSDDMLKNALRGSLGAKHGSLFQRAFDVSEDLIRSTVGTDILLHGDIHHFNILHSDRGWLAIDPKGIAGPRIYEYASTLVNPYMHETVTQPARMERQAEIIAEMAVLDKTSLLQFTFVHAMQCAAWSGSESDQNYWLSCARCAAQLTGISARSLDG